MIPLIREVVLKHGWLDEAQFLNMIGVAEVTPGPIAVNMATYVGSTQAGFLGALLCTLGVILPAFLIMLLISILLKKFMKNKYVQSALSGIKFVAIALIAASAITIFADVLFPYTLNNGISFRPNGVAIKMFILIVAGYFLLKIILFFFSQYLLDYYLLFLLFIPILQLKILLVHDIYLNPMLFQLEH